MNRKEQVARVAGAFLAASSFASACAKDNPTIHLPSPTPITESYPPKYDSEQERLKDIINSLPETEIKTLLLQKVMPILDNPSGTTILNIEGVPIKIRGIEITRKTQLKKEISGEFRPMGSPEKVETFFPIKDQTLKIPYFILTPAEKKILTPSNEDSVADVTFPKSNPLHEGIAPNINIVTIDPSVRKPESRKQLAFLENFVYVKEACGLLTYLLLLGDTLKNMHEQGYETHIESVDTNGEQINTEGVNRAIMVLSSNYGRLTAAQDLTAYLLAVKAFGDKFNLDYIAGNQREFYEKMKNTSLGGDPSKLLENSFQWVISLSPTEIPVNYQGNLNNIP